TAFENSGEKDFIMGYEESYGFLVGKHARDKDAVVASLLICEMAAYYKSKGFTLYDILKSLYHRFGYYLDDVTSIRYPGSAGKEKMAKILSDLRGREDMFEEPYDVRDYLCGFDGLPSADVLKYVFKDGSWIAVRPSGTEPILKCYYSIKGKNERDASLRLMRFNDTLSPYVE
ncbi:MAG: phospho-sugar mutase, partial [Firmicutes bacterium]|nr:phospho-sugar mutase [Bacillota bacterium]